MPKTKHKRLGSLLLEHNMITQTQLNEALQAQTIYGGKLGTNLVELGYISEATLTTFLSTQLNIPAIQPEDLANISKEVIDLVPKEFAKMHKLVPLKKEGSRLKVTIADPFDMAAIDELAFKTSLIIDVTIAPEILIVYALETYYDIAREARYIKLSGVTTEEMRISESLADEIQTQPAGAPKAHPYPLEHLARDLSSANAKEEIFNILLKYFEFYFQKLAIFILRHQVLQGFVAQGIPVTKSDFRKIEIPLSKPSVFKETVEKQLIYSGEIPAGEIHALIKSSLNITDSTAAHIIPLLLNNQTISLLLCSDTKNTEASSLPFKDFDTVAKKISYAFQILFLKKRILA